MSSKKSNSAQLVTVVDAGKQYFGGNQLWFQQNYLRGSGCGIIAVANLVHNLSGGADSVSKEDYMDLAQKLKRGYLFPLPGIGMNGWMLAFGTRRYLRKEKLKYKVRWGCLHRNMWKQIERMTAENIPVVLSIGPGIFPSGKKHMLPLYEKKENTFVPVAKTRAHYVSVTSMDGHWLEVSSWGMRYYISKEEYEEYVRKYSNYLFSNILVVTDLLGFS